VTFFKGSRYEHVGELVMEGPDGRQIRFKEVRVIAPIAAARRHRVAQHDRLDLLAERYLLDSESFWRICDANLALWPPDLTAEPGRLIVIPRSDG
jgi:hypothetical protein